MIRGVPISFAGKSTPMDLLVVDDMPVHVFIGSPTLEKLEARLDMGKCFVTVTIDENEVQEGL